eukprot:COSAG06_NODE_38557_length_422_cov_0.801858_1_plen_63_part_01
MWHSYLAPNAVPLPFRAVWLEERDPRGRTHQAFESGTLNADPRGIFAADLSGYRMIRVQLTGS